MISPSHRNEAVKDISPEKQAIYSCSNGKPAFVFLPGFLFPIAFPLPERRKKNGSTKPEKKNSKINRKTPIQLATSENK